MRILEIVLDGFKSYASRTVITDFDENFNAITGFNGSGKSNILDAICFVLGISTLSTVRVTNKQEFIYKNGQAGVTKANVTILFDNTDKTRCHEAYKRHDQISVRREYAVGGNTKCTINGTTVTNEKILQLFSMSGLNINNANFLIMQGRITQVINMKPSETLSLVEETAGTNAYEEIRKKTVKIVEKKDAKLMEIENILNSEVIPIMEQLKKENEEYMKYREVCTQHDVLEKKVKAAQYYEIREKLDGSDLIRTNYKETLNEIRVKKNLCENELSSLEKQKTRLQEQEQKLITDEDKKEMDQLKTQKNLLEQEIWRMTNEINDWEKKSKHFAEEIEKNKQINARRGTLLKKFIEDREKSKDQIEEHRKNVEDLKARLVTLERGGDIDEDFIKNRIEDLLRKKEMTDQEVRVKEDQIKSFIKRLETRKNELRDAQSVENFDFTAINTQIKELEAKLKGFPIPTEAEKAALESDRNEAQDEIVRLNHQMRGFDQNKFACNYQSPEANFDRNRVKGRVISLVSVKDERFAKALESGAGSRLFSIVVDSDVTGQLLLQKKVFGNVSILPLNKSRPINFPEDKKVIIQKTFGNKARVAIDLLEYAQENYNAIGLVFGGFVVCETKEIATKIAYDPQLKLRTVTLEGDTYSPDGTLSGGESSTHSVLTELTHFKRLEKQKEIAEKKLKDAQKKLQETENLREKYFTIQNDLDTIRTTKKSKEKSMQESSSTKLKNEIQDIEQKIELFQGDVKKLAKQGGDLDKEVVTLKRQSVGNPREMIAKTLSKAEVDLKKSIEGGRKMQGDIDGIEGEIESNSKEIQEFQEKIDELEERIKKQSADIQTDAPKLKTICEKLANVQNKYEKKLQDHMRHQEAFSELMQNIQTYTQDLEKLTNDQKSISEKLRALEKECENSLKILEDLEHNHPYIPRMESEVRDFDRAEGLQKLQHLHQEKERLSKRVNKKVASTLDDHTRRYNSLETKKGLVRHDKEKLLDIIQDLDQRKKTCIEETWRKVDRNLGEIYSMLLPGASARLEEVDEMSGLEMRVGFNGDWKSNLGELSGGQRSLLALSFILALLKVNPAPIYILDEIDAALDMSHTQNIGLMLRTHFNQSQFIVVSLKEGMFTNANVLFKTQFVEGRSVVERYSGNVAKNKRG